VWRLAEGSLVGDPLPGHDGVVNAVAAGALADGTPVAVSGDGEGFLQVWRLADGSPVGEPLHAHQSQVNAVAVGALADGTPVIISSAGLADQTVRVWRLADGRPVGEPMSGLNDTMHVVAVGTLADGTPVVASSVGIFIDTVRVWRLADGSPVGEPLRDMARVVDVVLLREGNRPAKGRFPISVVAIGTLPDGSPVVVTGGSQVDETVRVWRLDDGSPIVEPLFGHDDGVSAVAVGTLTEETTVVSGGDDETMRVWRLSDGTPLVPPLNLSQVVRGIAVYRNVIVSAVEAGIAVHELAL
jgi:WD40 repeat protein